MVHFGLQTIRHQHIFFQGQEQDAIAAFSKTQRDFITDCKKGKNPLGYSYPLHPYFWAVGALFGK